MFQVNVINLSDEPKQENEEESHSDSMSIIIAECYRVENWNDKQREENVDNDIGYFDAAFLAQKRIIVENYFVFVHIYLFSQPLIDK